jgi:hypothetical protein
MRFELRRVRHHTATAAAYSSFTYYRIFAQAARRHVRKTGLIFASDLMRELEILARTWKIHIMSKVCNVCDTFVHPAAFNP